MAIVFVGGSQRSGTTLLQTILCKSKGANPMVGEAKYLRQLVQAYAFGKRHFGGETGDYFTDPEELRRFHGGLLESFVGHVRLRHGSEHVVLKEPHLTMLFPEISELLPEARFLCVVRDPRDVIASMVEVGKKLDAEGIRDETMARMFTKRDMRELCRHYLSFYMPALKSASPGFMQRSLFLRYEDLVRDPADILPKVAGFTGLDLGGFEASTEDPGTGKVDFKSVGAYRKAWATELYGKKPSAERVGAYHKVLKAKEIAAIEQLCSGMLKRFKYVAAAPSAERLSA